MSPDLPTARVEPGTELLADKTGQGYQLLLGIEVTAEGRWVRRGVVVSYRSDNREFEQTLPAELIVCTPAFARANGGC